MKKVDYSLETISSKIARILTSLQIGSSFAASIADNALRFGTRLGIQLFSTFIMDNYLPQLSLQNIKNNNLYFVNFSYYFLCFGGKVAEDNYP